MATAPGYRPPHCYSPWIFMDPDTRKFILDCMDNLLQEILPFIPNRVGQFQKSPMSHFPQWFNRVLLLRNEISSMPSPPEYRYILFSKRDEITSTLDGILDYGVEAMRYNWRFYQSEFIFQKRLQKIRNDIAELP